MKDETELVKNLNSLIDETLAEIEELKKSSKFAASEIKIEGPGAKDLDGKPVNGSLDAKKAEDEEDEEKEEKDEVEKAEDEEDEEKEDKKDDKKIAQKEVDKHNEKKHGEAKDADTAFKTEEIKKSLERQETLLKSYVDSKFESFEKKIADLSAVIMKLADTPVQPRGIPSGVQALQKSEEVKQLNRSDVAERLLTLQKSGASVDTADLIKVEIGSMYDVQTITKKYGI